MANTEIAGEEKKATAGHLREEEEKDISDDLHDQALVWNPIVAVVDSMVLKCAVKLRLFDSIPRHSPISLPELATSLPSTPSPSRLPVLRRLLRYLAHLRLVVIHPDDSVTLTAASSVYLRESSEKSHAAYVKFFIEEDVLAPLHTLDACVDGDGATASFFELTALDPAVNRRFNAAMRCTVRPIIETVLEGWLEVFDGVNVLVDVGGGVGEAAAAVARAFSGIRCIVYDLAHVVREAPELEGVEFVAGDMLVSVPRADAWMFERVLHVFDDEKALQILNRCKEAIVEEKGKLIIIDDVISEDDAKELLHVKLAYDMMLMRYTGGKERTENEWRSLILKAGFTRCRITRVMALQHVIEARV